MLSVGTAINIPAFASTTDSSTTSNTDKQNQTRESQQSTDEENQLVHDISECFSEANSDNKLSAETEKCMQEVLDKYFSSTGKNSDNDKESHDENSDDTEDDN